MERFVSNRFLSGDESGGGGLVAPPHRAKSLAGAPSTFGYRLYRYSNSGIAKERLSRLFRFERNVY